MTAIRGGALGLAIALAIGCESSPTTGTREEPEASPAAIAPVSPPPTAPSAAPSASPGALDVSCQANPRRGRAPLRVEFTASASGASDYFYEWSFGDGEGSSNPNPAHTYAFAGTFEASVRVRAATEEASCARSIEVEPAATPPGNPPSATPAPPSSPVPSPTPTPAPTPTPTPPPQYPVTITSLGGNAAREVRITPPGATCPGACTIDVPGGTIIRVDFRVLCGPPPFVCSGFVQGACSAGDGGSCSFVANGPASLQHFAFMTF